MTIENAQWISELVQAYPEGAVSASGGNNHLHLLKKVLQNTFPNIDGEVTATPGELNQLASNENAAPTGMITLWYGALNNIPAGWALCDGGMYTDRTGSSISTPDLRNRFVVGAGDTTETGVSYSPGDTGGEESVALTISEMPEHNHHGETEHTSTEDEDSTRILRDGGGGLERDDTGPFFDNPNYAFDHSHVIPLQGDGKAHENRPPYHALAYIMKL